MALLIEHQGKRRYKLWFIDMDGNEDFLTMSLTWAEANKLESSMQERKIKEFISDFVLSDDATPDDYAHVLQYVKYKLQDEI